MNKIRKWVSFWLLCSSLMAGCTTSGLRESGSRTNLAEMRKHPYVILISIDGYRYDYTDRFSPPTLKKFRDEGSSAKSLLPVFPSKTFTNHYSIATGLYSENHGIVANRFYDPIRKEEYKLSDRKRVQDGSWYGGIPIWVAAEKQGMLAANYFWPGSEAEIFGFRPSYYYLYDPKITTDDRVLQIKKWLSLPEERRPHFLTLYFSDVDSAGHKFGPDSKEVQEAVMNVDHAINKLLSELSSLELPLDVVIVSDHGMQKLDRNKIVYLDDYFDLKSAKVSGDASIALLYFNDDEKKEAVYRALKGKSQNFRIYRKEEIPQNLHYSKNPRVGDLILIAEAPYSFGTHQPDFKFEEGYHGFDPERTPTMHGIFYARGPHIKKLTKITTFRNVHIYPFIMKILGLSVLSGIDGDEKVLDPILQAAP